MTDKKDYTKIVLPGDTLPTTLRPDDDAMEDDSEEKVVRLGPGLLQNQEQIIAIKAGVLHHREAGNRWWLDNNQKRYVPSVGESVIGVVTARLSDYYKVDIGSAHQALLPVLAFEGATKRNRPNLKVGSLLYARVSLANKHMEPELECINPQTQRADGYGELKDGFVIHCSLGLCRRLLDPETPILNALAPHFPFEIAVGINGRVWINTASPKHTVLLANAVRNSEYLSRKECQEMVRELINRM
ncbi:uncharacterized protein VTP21DRAFT_9847 [Calcarisporiella thermophila]|uniref:uncharacterized protein n=1 Tax=Calcarisporiella thermophila TaxID=911321 RepID=UPI0037444104